MKGPVYIHRPDEEPGSRRKRFAGFSRNALILSVAIHVLFGAGAAVFVVEVFDKKHITFHASEPPSQAMEVEHKVQMAKKNNVDSAQRHERHQRRPRHQHGWRLRQRRLRRRRRRFRQR